MQAVLKKLAIEAVNPGTCSGEGQWIDDPNGKQLISYNPSTGEPIAAVVQAASLSCEKVISNAHSAFLDWRGVPAPKRGLVLRDLADALRDLKEPLGDLVTLEMGILPCSLSHLIMT